MDNILFKQISHEVKNLDESIYEIEAYANVYGNEDSDGDISAKGSFKRTVNNNGKRIRVLKDHNSTIMLGVPKMIDAEDEYGLRTITQFNDKKEVARDMYSDIKLMKDNGLNAELSIGYWVMARDSKNSNIITEYKLMEYSFLSSWASNELALVTDMKSVGGFINLLTSMYDLPHSDPRLKSIEDTLKSLEKADPTEIVTLPEDSISSEELIKTLDQTIEKWLQK